MLYRSYRMCEWLASWFPARIAYAIARVVGVGLFLFVPRVRRNLIANQRHILPMASRREIGRNARLAAIAVSMNYFELFRLPSMSTEQVLTHFEGRGLEHLARAYARGKGVIVIAPHMGNYSVLPSYCSSLGFPTVAVVERIRDERLHDYFIRLRSNHDLQILTTAPEDVRHILKAIREGRVVMLLSDRNVGTSSETVTFFGERTLLPAGPALLSRRTGAPIMPGYTYRVSTTRSMAVGLPELHLPESTGTAEQRRRADTQAVARLMEELIQQAPADWAVLQPVWPPHQPEVPTLTSEATN